MRPYLLLLSLFLLVSAAVHGQKIPPEKELNALVEESLLEFDKAVQSADFTGFHKYISAFWRKEVTPEKLQAAFQPFIDKEVTISGIADVEPVFTQPPAMEQGLLVVRGRYPTRPMKVEFQLKYVNEKTAWKLAGIRVNLAGTEARAPSEEEAAALVRDSLLAFNAAVQKKDFTQFHKNQIAALWRRQISAEKLMENFQPFIEQEANLSAIAKLDPAFDQPPAVDDDGVLTLSGAYPTQPSRVRFQLGYLWEDPDWKLVKIDVNVRPEAGEDEETAEE